MLGWEGVLGCLDPLFSGAPLERRFLRIRLSALPCLQLKGGSRCRASAEFLLVVPCLPSPVAVSDKSRFVMSKKKINDDLFEGSSMSFGDHLEELRGVLFKSIIWLIGGLAIGLFFAHHVMDAITAPVERALVKYHQDKAYKTMIEAGEGRYTPEEEEQLAALAKETMWEPVEIFVEPQELERVLKISARWPGGNPPSADPEIEAPAPEQPEPETDEDPAELDDLLYQMRLAPESNPVAMLTWRRISASTEALRVEEVFMIWLKAGLIFGAIIASPGIFYHIWQFIAAGLYPHEQRYVWVFLPFSLMLFFGGAALAYFKVFEPVLDFLFSFNLMIGIDPRPRISEWMGFVLMLPLGFGLSFQLPLVMLMLNRIGLVSIEGYIAQWRIAVVVIFGLSAFLTPAEPISMMMMAIPLTILYFGGIGLCRWFPSSRSPFGDPATG